MRGRPRIKRRRGFTLIEALATIVILAALGSVASTVLLSSADGYFDASTRSQLHSEISMALDRAVRELRKIKLDSSAPGIAPDINIYASIGLLWHTPRSLLVGFGGILYLQIDGGPLTVLLHDVTGFTVTAYDQSNNVIAAPQFNAGCDPIRRLELEVTVTRYGVSETLRTKVFLRSTMDGA